MSRAASRWAMGALVIGLAVMTGGCSHSGRALDRRSAGVDGGGPTWSLPKECQSCLLRDCDPPESGIAPYGACASEPGCFAAFASFAECFGRKPLKDCGPVVATLKQSGEAGGELLACFMHSCFVEGCELTRFRSGASSM